jgi:alanine-glyoxylate transaminase / serine-glyoxylate transaminase / serine-pyruvate transaminase
MDPDDVLTMIPGPTPVHPTILEALGRPTVSHQAPSFVATYRRCLERLRRVARAELGHPFVVAGAGTLAMEMALVNLVGRGEELLVVSHGYFGDRWSEIAEAFGVRVRVLRAAWGHAVPPDDLAAALDESEPAAVALTHVDTSTGTAAPVEAYCERLRGRRTLAILDGVCAMAGVDERFDDWGLDVLLTGAQKALGAPPGVAILLVSDRALDKRDALGSVPAYFADLGRWRRVMDDPSVYFSTPAVNEIRALDAALALVLEEGLAARFERHFRIAAAMRAGLDEHGLRLFTAPDCRAPTLSVVVHGEGVDDARFREAIAAHGVVVAGGLGPLAGRGFRIGHMGNIGLPEVLRTLEAIGAGLAACGRAAGGDRALAAAEAAFRG